MVEEGWIAFALEYSGVVTFASLGIWVALRAIALVADLLGPRPVKSFPISAQKMGFASGLARHSVILSEAEYKARQGRMGFLHRLAKVWWPVMAWAALTQFVMLYGARGLANELEVPFWVGLGMSASALGALGMFRRRMIQDHFKESFLPEGKELDWDAEAFVGGIRLRARFEGRPRKVVLSRLDESAIAKDRSEIFHYHGIAAQPDSVHEHGAGLIVSEFCALDKMEERMDESNWLSKIKLRDALRSTLSAYVVANQKKMPAVALIEYPGAVVMVSPLIEHVQFVEHVAERLRSRKKTPAINARDAALSAGQEFYTKFDEAKVAELLERQEWVSRDRMAV